MTQQDIGGLQQALARSRRGIFNSGFCVTARQTSHAGHGFTLQYFLLR